MTEGASTLQPRLTALARGGDEGVLALAEEAHAIERAGGGAVAWLAGAADDPGRAAVERVAALETLAVLAAAGIAIPDAALAVLDDDALVDAVLDRGRVAAITGLLAVEGARVPAATRSYLGHRLAGHGAGGIAVARVLADVGDLDGAARTAARAIAATLVPADAEGPDALALALAEVLRAWLRGPGAADLAARIAAQLPTETRGPLRRAIDTLAVGPEELTVLSTLYNDR